MSHQETQNIFNGCHALGPWKTPYDYVPWKAAGVVFVLFFGLSGVGHMVQFCWKRTWWCSVFTIGCLGEFIGWGARLTSAHCPYNSTAYLIQISTLIISPVFFTAGLYILLGRLIMVAGRESSYLSPKAYLWIFCVADVISLLMQAAGGGLASIESSARKSTALGSNLMLAGIIFQMFSITIFVICAIDFVRRTSRCHLIDPHRKSLTPMLCAMFFSLTCIYVRSIYRVVELAQGWAGFLITHQIYFVILDGMMMALAVGVFNFVHPGWMLSPKSDFEMPKEVSTVSLNTSSNVSYATNPAYAPTWNPAHQNTKSQLTPVRYT
ncbi:RTA1-domain-containing protein [Penicillium riverlandense]|uniref:RTA1-domain-containing protein n=1 Tax=Penicillium riverlandense TaxID=1903569 RepID=UPI0025470369|nr:RTA1-domain-containing protein [Penicillium riverlandense]KAJ5811273.1 RTA1-domain-containing protein [Penicillium riverlandense]